MFQLESFASGQQIHRWEEDIIKQRSNNYYHNNHHQRTDQTTTVSVDEATPATATAAAAAADSHSPCSTTLATVDVGNEQLNESILINDSTSGPRPGLGQVPITTTDTSFVNELHPILTESTVIQTLIKKLDIARKLRTQVPQPLADTNTTTSSENHTTTDSSQGPIHPLPEPSTTTIAANFPPSSPHPDAEKLKTKANQDFKLKRYTEAIRGYNQVSYNQEHTRLPELHQQIESALLLNRLVKNYTGMAICLTNRATSLFHLGLYEYAACDCHEARVYDHTYSKAVTRLAEIEFKRGCYSQCLELAQAVPSSLHPITLVDCMRAAQSKVDEFGITRTKPIHIASLSNKDAISVQTELVSSNPRLAHASSSIEMCESDSCGRYLSAMTSIIPRTILISEVPYAAILKHTFRPRLRNPSNTHIDLPTIENMDQFDQFRCEWCFSRLQLDSTSSNGSSSPTSITASTSTSISWFLPCSSCLTDSTPGPLYCSPTCRSDAWEQEHQFECLLDPFLQRLTEVTRLAIRMCTRPLVEQFEQVKHQQSIQTNEIKKWSGDAKDVHSLLTHLADLPASALIEYQFQAGLCQFIFQELHQRRIGCTSGQVIRCTSSDSSTPSATPSSHSLTCWHHSCSYESLLHHLCQTRTNVYAITQLIETVSGLNHSATSISEQIRLALAIYPTASLMNHACRPNVGLTYYGRKLVVRASEPIPADGQIWNNYGPHQGHMTKKARLKVLKEEYFFDCLCQSCQQLHELDEFRCTQSNCAGILSPTSEHPNQQLICSECHDFIPLRSIELIEIKLKKMEQDARQLMKIGKFTSSLPIYRTILDRQLSIYTPSHSRLSQTYDTLAECSVQMGEFMTSANYLEEAIRMVELRFGSHSVEVGHELGKLAQIYFHACQSASCLRVIERALSILTTYGYSSSTSDEVRDLLGMQQRLRE